MKREILEKLIEWKNREDRKPLVLTGARQVGKTWVLKELGQTQFEKMVCQLSAVPNRGVVVKKSS